MNLFTTARGFLGLARPCWPGAIENKTGAPGDQGLADDACFSSHGPAQLCSRPGNSPSKRAAAIIFSFPLRDVAGRTISAAQVPLSPLLAAGVGCIV